MRATFFSKKLQIQKFRCNNGTTGVLFSQSDFFPVFVRGMLEALKSASL